MTNFLVAKLQYDVLDERTQLSHFSTNGGGPPMVRFGATLSKPYPREPYKKNSASRYSKFSANSTRSTSVWGMELFVLLTIALQ